MATIVYIATLGYARPDGSAAKSMPIGVFSSEEKAKSAVENFKEGTLYMELPDAQVTAESIEKYVLDQVLGEDGGGKGQLAF